MKHIKKALLGILCSLWLKISSSSIVQLRWLLHGESDIVKRASSLNLENVLCFTLEKSIERRLLYLCALYGLCGLLSLLNSTLNIQHLAFLFSPASSFAFLLLHVFENMCGFRRSRPILQNLSTFCSQFHSV